jgi:hypothetical protein
MARPLIFETVATSGGFLFLRQPGDPSLSRTRSFAPLSYPRFAFSKTFSFRLNDIN